VPQPVQLDFQALAEGVVRNNVGVDAIALRVRARLDRGSAVLTGTEQRLPVTGATATTEPWLWFEVTGFEPAQRVELRFLRGTPGPQPGAGAAAPAAVK